ncbi:hypothetical protein [Hafnia alvei]|uniref:hypothetical protein n=1 Tax=Hafnia alvei TaxID=569 RepID=UPI0010330E4D|nr:hypothetical protein [Hafnia alvei]TBL94484.1 hypothetical protein EYY90_10955 [Hafnia alvei]
MLTTTEVTYDYPGKKFKPEDAWIGNQLVSISDNCLEIQTAKLAFSSTLGHFWSQAILLSIFYIGVKMSSSYIPILLLLIPIDIVILYNAMLNIKKNSNIVFNRATQMAYVHLDGKDYSSPWSSLLWTSTININGMTKIYFTLLHKHPDNTQSIHHVELSNDNRSVMHGLTTFINVFMQQGRKELVIPKFYEWRSVFSTKVTLSPSEIWQHYAPWPFRRRYCDSVEMNMKIIFWPIWTFLLFPLLTLFALSWWLICKVFKITPASVPLDARQEDCSERCTPQFAAKRLKPFEKDKGE